MSEQRNSPETSRGSRSPYEPKFKFGPPVQRDAPGSQPGGSPPGGGGGFRPDEEETIPEEQQNIIVPPRRYSFETKPDPISASRIKQTVSTDVVVVGGGISGMCAALAAAEKGAKVILVEKTETFQARGSDNAYIGSRLQKKLGIEIDKDEVVLNLMKQCDNKPHQRILRLWSERGAEISDWLFDMTDASGIKFSITGYPPFAGWDPKKEYYPQYLVTHAAEGGETAVVECIMQNALQKGVTMQFNTRAVQLVREENSRVASVIAQSKDGDFVQYNAGKAVILCTGDFGNNNEMMAKYAPHVQYLASKLPTSTGDGHQMAMWVGAQMEQGLGAPVTHGFAGPLGSDAFLQVNRRGERFHNEDVTGQAYTNQVEKQPGQDAWQVFDAKYPEQLPFMGIGHGKVTAFSDSIRDYVEETCQKADTIEALAKLMEVPVETFKSTIKRYNELADAGKDIDFAKRADRLFPVETPPFYACKGTYEMLVIMLGLNTNTKLQALDVDWRVIPGLYVAGNVVGNRFGVDYPLACPGLTHALATVTGYIAGENAATMVA